MGFIFQIDYKSIDYSSIAMQIMEYDITCYSAKYHIRGYTQEDVAQELRLKLWKALPKYDPSKCGMRTWAIRVMKNHLNNLSRDAKRHKRIILYHEVSLNDELDTNNND